MKILINLRKINLPLLVIFAFITHGHTQISQHEATENPNKEDWISLFNGKDLFDWVIKIADYPLNHNLYETFVGAHQ